VVDRLVGLRLGAVVGGDDDDREVGDAGAAARTAVNASWPGVSRKVIALPLWRTW
jgi:hypothetical protein